ncbi:MAG: redoxin domain-containing protein [Saprospiraceae bacterium]|nr:redoxin domain-containing protein [Saprospiraceae bacterium]
MDGIKKQISFLNETDSISRQKLADSLKTIGGEKEEWEDQYLKDNFNSYIGLLMHIYRHNIDYEKLQTLFESTSPALKESIYGRAIQTQIDFPKPIIGAHYYDFNGSDLNGGEFKLSDISDKFILLQFAGTACYGSNLSVNDMEKIYGSYGDSIEFISIFYEPYQETCSQYIEERALPWKSVWTKGGKYGVVPDKYGVVGTPTFFLISPNKEVVSTWFGFDEGMIQNEIKKAISIL